MSGLDRVRHENRHLAKDRRRRLARSGLRCVETTGLLQQLIDHGVKDAEIAGVDAMEKLAFEGQGERGDFVVNAPAFVRQVQYRAPSPS